MANKTRREKYLNMKIHGTLNNNAAIIYMLTQKDNIKTFFKPSSQFSEFDDLFLKKELINFRIAPEKIYRISRKQLPIRLSPRALGVNKISKSKGKSKTVTIV